MKTFEINIADSLYFRAVSHAEKMDMTFSDLCSLAVIELIDCSDAELEHRAEEFAEEGRND